MKILNFYTVALISIFTFTACNKDYLEVEPKGQFLSENYYADQTQAFSALVGVYDVLRKNSGGFENIVAMMNAGSDDHVAGGGGSSPRINASTCARSIVSYFINVCAIACNTLILSVRICFARV